MSKLEDLIQELCPNGVEHVPLWSITTWDKKFNSVEKQKQRQIIKYNYYLASDLKALESPNGTIKILTTNITDLYAKEEDVIGMYSEGEVVCIPWGGNPIVQYYKGKFITGDNRIATSNNLKKLLNKFLYYFLLNNIQVISSFYRGSGIKHPDMSKVLDLSIPLPPMPVQEEIVRILDSFTELTTELTAELTARKKQYEYYLNSFFGADIDKMISKCKQNNIPIDTLENIGSLQRGKRFVKADAVEIGAPCIHYGELYTHYGVWAKSAKSFLRKEQVEKLRVAQKGDVIIVGAGENDIDIGIGVAWFGDDDIAVHDACYAFKHKQNPKYISYYLRSNVYHTQIKKYVSSGKICAISASGIGKSLIPLPSLEEQKRIVDILDRFDKLCNDISEGLPAEIEARQKQYEYYRDKLLTFKEMS